MILQKLGVYKAPEIPSDILNLRYVLQVIIKMVVIYEPRQKKMLFNNFGVICVIR